MAPDDVSFHPSRFMIIPNTKRHPKNTKTDQLPTSEVITGLPRPYHNTMIRLCSVAWVHSDALVGQHVVWLRVAKARSVKMYKLATKVYIYIWCAWRLYFVCSYPMSWFSRSNSVQQLQQQAMEQVSCSLARSITLPEETAATRYIIKLYLQGINSCLRSYKVSMLYTTRSIRSIYN